MSEEYIKAIKKERDEWEKKYQDLKEEIRTSCDDSMIGKRLKEWVEYEDKPELYADYPNHKYYIDKMKLLLKGELHD